MSNLPLEDITHDKYSVDAFIGHRLRNIRLKSGIKLSEIAKRLNLSMQLIQKYETGVTRIPVSALCRIADILNTNPSYFFDGYEQLFNKSGNVTTLSHVKTDSLNILLVSASIDIEYMVQNLKTDTGLKISIFTVIDPTEIHDYARQLTHTHHTLPVPDIVLYDMPVQKSDIQDFIKKIRLNPLNIEAPIIILSMNPDIDAMKKAYYYGVSGYIYKNIPTDELQNSLKYMLLYWGKGCNLNGTVGHIV